MKKYEKNIDDRKLLVARLSELTGLDARYTRVPRCAYEVGAFTVEKDGRLTVEDGADQGIIETLISENMIGACIEETHPEAAMPTEQPAPAPAQILQPDLGTEEWGEDDWEEAETTEAADDEPDEEQEVWQPDTDIFTEQVTQEAVTETDATDDEVIADAEIERETAEEPVEEAAEEITEEAAEEMATEEPEVIVGGIDAEETAAFPVDARISFPLSNHTVSSLANLICMIHTRGPLISKATGGTFYVDKDLVNDILDRHTFIRPEDLIAFVEEWDGSENAVQGLAFDKDKVIFDGFTGVRDADHLQTFTKLAAAMNKMAQTQKRVQAKETNDTNEKYSLRVWLVRLGLNGPEYKMERKLLMKNLTGHAAFRTKADEDKWRAKQQLKKEALRAAKTKAED